MNKQLYPIEVRDNRGNIIYWENSNKFWQKSTYNELGQKISYENSSGTKLKTKEECDKVLKRFL